MRKIVQTSAVHLATTAVDAALAHVAAAIAVHEP
jgi:hypothetical protein